MIQTGKLGTDLPLPLNLTPLLDHLFPQLFRKCNTSYATKPMTQKGMGNGALILA